MKFTKEQSVFLMETIESAIDNRVSPINDRLCDIDCMEISEEQFEKEYKAEYDNLNTKADVLNEMWSILDRSVGNKNNGIEVIENNYPCEWNVFVGVMTPNGMKYVTKSSNYPKEAFWHDNEEAHNFYDEVYAREVVVGLLNNGHYAFVIKMPDTVSHIGNWVEVEK